VEAARSPSERPSRARLALTPIDASQNIIITFPVGMHGHELVPQVRGDLQPGQRDGHEYEREPRLLVALPASAASPQPRWRHDRPRRTARLENPALVNPRASR
jgi:hypothetical protein